jgi:uncharacterized protein (TIGR02145 family)
MKRNVLLIIGILFFISLLLNCSKNPTNSDNNAITVTDADGNVYHTVTLGTQTWTVENLRTTKYNDGTIIPLVSIDTVWVILTTPAYCYNNNTTNTDSIYKFGALYNWYAVNTGKLAPTGWHVPSNAEWDTLVSFLILNGYNFDGTTSGNKIAKAMAAKMYWTGYSIDTGSTSNNLYTNNRSGFSALPGSLHYDFQDGWSHSYFNTYGSIGVWFTTMEYDSLNIYCRRITNYYNSLDTDWQRKVCGLSVRLVKDN